jgi:hypothetical protein
MVVGIVVLALMGIIFHCLQDSRFLVFAMFPHHNEDGVDSIWQILFGWGVISIVGTLLIGIGWAVMSAAPPDFTVARVCFSVAAMIVSAKSAAWIAGVSASRNERTVAAFMIFGLIGASWVWSYSWVLSRQVGPLSPPVTLPTASPTRTQEDEQPPTLLDLFNKEFGNTMKATDTNGSAYKIQTPSGATIDVRRQVYMDFPARNKFVGFYIYRPSPPSVNFKSEKTVLACFQLLQINAVQKAFDDFGKQVGVMGGQGGQMTTFQDLTFSGRVVIYHEEFLSIPQKANIINAYHVRHLDVQFFGDEYLGLQLIAWHQKHDAKTH